MSGNDDLYKMFKPVLTPEQINDEQLLGMTMEEFARLPADMPEYLKVMTALLYALEKRLIGARREGDHTK
jgi:hypothetical protein